MQMYYVSMLLRLYQQQLEAGMSQSAMFWNIDSY